MESGEYREGAAVLRIKTDLNHPNPAVRDWPALRVIDTEKTPHPRVGAQFKAWPLYNLASGADDHLLGITHIIRGKEHLTNMARQLYLYEYMGWKYPDAVHYGRLKVEGMILSKSKLIKALETGEVTGVDDPRLRHVSGIAPTWLHSRNGAQINLGSRQKPVDVAISWDNIKPIESQNSRSNRSPILLCTKSSVSHYQRAASRLRHQHAAAPSTSYRGTRTLKVHQINGETSLDIASSYIKTVEEHQTVRMMGLFNVTIRKENNLFVGQYVNETNVDEKNPILQWVPSDRECRGANHNARCKYSFDALQN